MNSLALYLSTPTPPHTLHAYKLHEKNAPQVQSEFKISHCLVAAQRFEKQGETFFQLLRFVIPESENYCYCPVICRSHSVAFMSSSYPLNHWVTLHMLWMGTLFYYRTKRDHSQQWYLVTGKLTKPCLQNTDQSITKPPHPSLWGGVKGSDFSFNLSPVCNCSHTHTHTYTIRGNESKGSLRRAQLEHMCRAPVLMSPLVSGTATTTTTAHAGRHKRASVCTL